MHCFRFVRVSAFCVLLQVSFLLLLVCVFNLMVLPYSVLDSMCYSSCTAVQVINSTSWLAPFPFAALLAPFPEVRVT